MPDFEKIQKTVSTEEGINEKGIKKDVTGEGGEATLPEDIITRAEQIQQAEEAHQQDLEAADALAEKIKGGGGDEASFPEVVEPQESLEGLKQQLEDALQEIGKRNEAIAAALEEQPSLREKISGTVEKMKKDLAEATPKILKIAGVALGGVAIAGATINMADYIPFQNMIYDTMSYLTGHGDAMARLASIATSAAEQGNAATWASTEKMIEILEDGFWNTVVKQAGNSFSALVGMAGAVAYSVGDRAHKQSINKIQG
ncbi:MAG: hypothetical protein WAW00_01780 [Candidatus Moraniibacteriota bacterium]